MSQKPPLAAVENHGPLLADYQRLEATAFPHARTAALSVIVCGAGALGNAVVEILGRLGTGRVLVIDPDSLAPTDLIKSTLLRLTHGGGNKARLLAQAASTIFPDTRWSTLECAVADAGFRHLSEADLIFSCVDSDLARTEIAYVSTKLDRPCCDAGMAASGHAMGRVTFFPGRNHACFSCLLSSRRRAELLTRWESEAHPCRDTLDHAAPFPSLPTLAALIGSLQVHLGLQTLLAAAPPAGAFSVELSLDGAPALRNLRIAPSSSCPFHELPQDSRLDSSPSTCAAGDLCDHSEILLLDWPVCSSAVCSTCRAVWAPMLRLGLFRAIARCPHCGGTSVAPREVLRSIAPDSPWAERSLHSLGVAPYHLHTILRRPRS